MEIELRMEFEAISEATISDVSDSVRAGRRRAGLRALRRPVP
jgi:hypothetical protein